MRLSSLIYLTRQGFKSFYRNRLMTATSVSVLTVCLFVTGAAVLLGLNVNSFVEYLAGQNEIVVYLQDADTIRSEEEALSAEETAEETAAEEQTAQPDEAATEQEAADPEAADPETADLVETEPAAEPQPEVVDIQAAVAVMESIDNVESYVYVSKDEALTEAIGWMGHYASLLEGYREDNPMPASFRVTIKDLTQLEDTVNRLQQIQGVEYVSSPSSMTSILVNLRTAVIWAAAVLVLVLALVCAVVIGNTIRLTIFARRKEISIMRYVGATNTFVRYPFFVEGITIGLLAALIAFGLVSIGYTKLADMIYRNTGDTMVWLHNVFYHIIPYSNLRETLLLSFLGSGALLGGLGTSFGVRKYLKV